MKKLLILFFFSFLLFSCNEESLIDFNADNEVAFKRIIRDCEPKFEEGRAIDIFGAPFTSPFAVGYKGSFESQLLLCSELSEDNENDCCQGIQTVNKGFSHKNV